MPDDDDGLAAWRDLDVLAAGLGDERLELVLDVVRRLVLGKRVSRAERDLVIGLLAPVAADIGVEQIAVFLAEAGE
jgi:hypothetical protein